MVSFRNEQFHAALMGVIIADALSHGQLPRSTADCGTTVPTSANAAVSASPNAVVDDRWCHEMMAQLRQIASSGYGSSLSRQHSPSTASGTASGPYSGSSEAVGVDALAQIPDWLLNADVSAAAFLPLQPPITPSADFPETAWPIQRHRLMSAALRHDLEALAAVARSPRATVNPVGPWSYLVTSAVSSVVAAHGNFELAVLQSLYARPALVGLPILTGILSASGGSCRRLPNHWQQWLMSPSSSLQAWLEQRWHMSTMAEMTPLSYGLWRQWVGSDRATPERTANPVVLPAIAPLSQAL